MFLRHEGGSLAVILAIALPVLLVGVGGAVETSRAVTFRQRLWSAVELSCAQGAAYVNAQKPLDVTTKDKAKTYPCKGRTNSRPLWRSKTRPLASGRLNEEGARSGPFLVRRRA